MKLKGSEHVSVVFCLFVFWFFSFVCVILIVLQEAADAS